MKRTSWIAVASKSALVISAIAGGVLLVAWITDVHDDRTYRLVITGAVTVYEDPLLPDKNHPNRVLTVVGPHDGVEVRRINRDGGWVRVRLPDKREGYIFLDAKIELRRW